MNVSKGMLIGTVLVGAVYFVIGEIFYNAFQDILPMPLLIGLYFLGLAVFVAIGCAAIVALMYHYNQGYRDIVLRSLLLFLAVFAAAALFEFLYELQLNGRNREPGSYIFLMDSSGSMEANDPENRRYEAIQSVLANQEEDFPFAVYTFANDSTLVRDMGPVSQGTEFQMEEPYGGTAIRTVLEDLYDDIDSGVIDPGKNGKVILFSDGYATDMGLFGFGKIGLGRVLKKFSKANLSISAVGLGDPDDDLMERIAGKTGGVYISVDDASQLNDAMKEAVRQESSRNLLDYRSDVKFDFLYTILRFVAVLVIGVLLAGLKTYISESVLDTQPVLISSIIGSLLAAFCVEFGMNKLGLFPWLMRLLMCVLLAAATLLESWKSRRDYSDQYRDEY